MNNKIILNSAILLALFGVLALAALAWSTFRFPRAASGRDLLDAYFEAESFTILGSKRIDGGWQGNGGLWINLKATAIVPRALLTEQKCHPALPPSSLFYKEIEDTDFSAEVAAGTYLNARSVIERKIMSRLTVHCYQVTKDLGRGFPLIKVFHDRATGDATIEFPHHLL